jgi:two-component system cell cycle sensor histidine kinase/response regulator CckA
MEAIGRLAGGLAHDFNNQLQAVAGFATFIEREEDLGPGGRADLDQVKKAAERMASLTRQLLAFSRQQLLTPETVELGSAVVEARPLLQRLIGPVIQFRVESPAEPIWVRVDRAQLLQVLMNLAINARDAMPDGGLLDIAVDSEIVTAPRPCEAGVVMPGIYGRLSVRDTGTGIPPEHLPHVFEPFFTTKSVGEGTGLGLATVHGIVAQSHGHVAVHSRLGQGTEFLILLPMVEPPPSRDAAGTAQRDAAAGGVRVLAADDEAPILEVMRRTLEEAGYEVLLARDGTEVLAVLERERGGVDLLLCDVAMPNMSGMALAGVVAERYPDLPVVWLSGYPRETAFRGDDRSRQPFLQKPVDTEQLLTAIRGALHKV